MASGQKYNDDIKERAYALFDTNNNVEYVSRKLGVPESTLRGWKRRYEKELEKDPVRAEQRAKYKADFVRRAWSSINMAQSLLARRLERALANEDAIDALIELVDEEARESRMSEKKRRELIESVASLKCDDIGKLVAILGTLYDKQALANKEETEIVGGSVRIDKFEDM